MVCTHLAAVGCILSAHSLLDEGMATLGQYRHTAGILYHFNGIPGQPGVVDDTGTGLKFKKGVREQAYNVVPLDKFSALVKKETSVKIAVPANTKICAMLTNGRNRSRAILGQ